MSETMVTDVKTGGRSGKGSVPLTVSVLNFDPSLGCDSATFQPCSERALSTLRVIGDAFKGIYPISKGLPSDQSSGLFGFFLEDELLGGHVRRPSPSSPYKRIEPVFFSSRNISDRFMQRSNYSMHSLRGN